MELETYKTSPAHAIVGNTLAVLLMFLSVFLPAGRLDYWQGWAYVAIYALIPLLIYRFVPGELMKERRNSGQHAKVSENIFMVSYSLLAFVTPAISSLDAGRFRWTEPFPAYINVVFFFIIMLSGALVIWSMRVNRFFSSVIRIQSDRGHYVIQNGPYAVVRHPGYAGVILNGIAAPLALGSFAGLVPVFLLLALTVIRTGREDRTLKRDLPGYREYARKVRSRLVPGIW